MAMIPIVVHIGNIAKEYYDKVAIPVLFPFVPRINERVILSENQKERLLDLVKTIGERYHISKSGIAAEWDNVMDEMDVVNEVSYHGEDGSIHIDLSTE